MKEKFGKFLESKSVTAEDFKGKSAEEKAGLYNEFMASQIDAVNQLAEKGAEANAEAIKALKEEISAARAEQMKELNETLKQMGLSIQKFRKESEQKNEKPNTLRKGLLDNIDKLKALKKGDKSEAKNNEFSFKAPADMLISTNVSG